MEARTPKADEPELSAAELAAFLAACRTDRAHNLYPEPMASNRGTDIRVSPGYHVGICLSCHRPFIAANAVTGATASTCGREACSR